ncbi:cytochrome c biogenesis CcdA family protein [Methanospirillum sp.]|uniref:cytochrome c biogenesis CcdA family protein n=1 Tax=Methanospirillum sp. TaxID=45200 RepID=UPI00359F73B2
MITTTTQKFLFAGIVALIFLSCLTGPASGSVYLKNGTEINENAAYITILQDQNTTAETLSIRFFYNTHCGACHYAMDYLDEYQSLNPGIIISYHDLFNSTDNRELFENNKAEYNRQYASVPVIFMGNAVLEGSNAIRTNFDPLVKGYTELNKGGYSFPSLPWFTTSSSSTSDGNSISIPLIIVAGLLDGINPCAFAVIVILLIYLMSLSSRQKIILAGIVYSAALFLACFLSGVGVFSAIQEGEMVKGFSFVAAVIAIIAGILMIKDAFYPEKGPSPAIPEGRKGTINRYIEKSSIPSAFILGILAGMFKLPCNDGIYLAILSMISLRMTVGTGLGYLLIYNFAFILPLLVIIALVAWGLSPEQVSEFRVEQKRLIRIIIGCIMFFFAAIILMELF